MNFNHITNRPAAGFGPLTTGEAKRLKDAEAEDAFARERVERSGRPARDKGNAR